MDKITVYEKPTCSTCRKTIKLLKEKGYDFDRINYYTKPFTKKQLKILLKKMKMRPGDLLRKNEAVYKKLGFNDKEYSDSQIIDFMLLNYDLIQRPIVEKGDKAVLARPVEKIEELF